MASAPKPGLLTQSQLDELRQLSTCVVASAIETFAVRMNNTGFADFRVQCQFKELPPVLGYAATARIRSEDPPMEGDGYFYYDRPDWWRHILSIPAPRVIVIEDIDTHPGLGAFVGSVHAHILAALGCVALVTNGAVRDIPDVRSTGVQLFAGGVAVSHAYAHLFDFGSKVRVGGLDISPRELVHGDMHGVQTIPLEIAPEIPVKAREILKRRKRLIDLCRSGNFSPDAIQRVMKQEEEELNV